MLIPTENRFKELESEEEEVEGEEEEEEEEQDAGEDSANSVNEDHLFD